MSLPDLYNRNVNVNYKSFEVSDDDNDALSQTEYRKQLLQTFDIEVEQFDSLTCKIDKIYDTIRMMNYWKNNERKLFDEILLKLAGQLLSEDKSMGFAMLFSYDYFDKIIVFITDYLYNNTVNTEILNELKNKICN